MFQMPKTEKKTFDFCLEGSKEIHSVPLLQNLPISKIRKIRSFVNDVQSDDDVFEMLDFLCEIFGEELIDGMTVHEASYLFYCWQQTSNGGEVLSFDEWITPDEDDEDETDNELLGE